MCFGMQQTGATTTNTNQATSGNTSATGSTSSTANPYVAAAATQNVNDISNLQTAGFQPYQGQQVADMSPLQAGTLNNAGALANSPNFDTANSLINQYSSAGPQSVTAGTVSPESIASNMSPYMNQYVMQALAPQLQQMNTANAATNQATDALATSHGGYGDARTGIQQSTNAFNQNVAQEGLIGNAYNSAFNTAIGAGAQDSANNLTAQTTNVGNNLSAQNANAGYNETALQRALSGSTALQNSTINQMGVQTSANALGQQQTAQQQAQLTALYNQWQMAQQYPLQTSAAANSAIGAAASAMPATTNTSTNGTTNSATNTVGSGTTSAADNSGLSFLGTLASAFI